MMSYGLRLGLFLFTGFVIASPVSGQTTITGRVTDALTGESIPSASIVFPGTTTGTITNFDGYYSLQAKHPGDSITVSFIGYETLTQKVKPNVAQVINFKLQPKSIDLEGVVITVDKKYKDPAVEFMKRVSDARDRNNPDNLSAYEYEVYSKIELDLNNVNQEFRDKKIMRHFGFMFEQQYAGDSVTKPYIPIILAENVSSIYFRRDPKAQKEIVKGSQISGIKNESIQEQLNNTSLRVNVYDNYINVFNKGFVSPLAGTAPLFYKFYLTDSAVVDGHYAYQVTYKPRREEDLVFSGTLWIDTTSLSLLIADLHLSKKADLNWVNDLVIHQEFSPVDSNFMLKKELVQLDFSITEKEDKVGFYARKQSSYKDFVINQPKETSFYDNTLVLADSSAEREEDYWQQARHDSLTDKEEMIFENVQKLAKIPFFMSVRDISATILKGYHSLGKVEIGPYMKLVTHNEVEGLRTRLGLRTNGNFSKKVRFDVHGAYGFGDERFKYGAGMLYLFEKKPRVAAGIRYFYDIEQIGQSETAYEVDHILGSLLRRQELDKLSMVSQSEAWLEKEWVKGISNTVSLVNRDIYSHQFDDFSNFGGYVRSTSVILATRIAPGEKVILGDFDQTPIGSPKFAMRFQYEYGFKEPIGGDFEFHHIKGDIKQHIGMGALGYSKYVLSAGKIFGTLPYVLLNVLPGNENYTFDHQSYNLMNYYEFVTDEYVSLYYTYYLDGLILDKIPLVKKLKFRELVWAKGIVGKLNPRHNELHPFPSFLSGLNEPYYEGGFGIENIFKALRLDFFWRFSHLDKADVSNFAIRGSLQIKF